MRRLVFLCLANLAVFALASTAAARVLMVGTYHGIRGQFRSIQAAVDAAKPGDWILIGPGDYKTSSWRSPHGAKFPAGVLITTPRLHIRGMNRNTVVVDGTKPGSAKCSAKKSAQNFGPKALSFRFGVNGLMVWKANHVSVQNLTACNFLGGSGGDGVTGNEIWWNGGAGSGKVGGWGYNGSYLTATSTYYTPIHNGAVNAYYGIFTSNWSGGVWNWDYASNFSDSGYYIGACRQICDQTVNHVWGEFSALGYSGSNSGGKLIIKNSQFDHNNDGFDTNSQNGDNPPPQNGACPHNGVSPITHTHSCWVFMDNYVHDNNNPNVPRIGAAASGPVGTGMSISAGRNDTVMHNRFVNNHAWGVIVIPYLDSGPPCTGGMMNVFGKGSCLFDNWGNAVIDNKFSHNGGYGHPTNGDIAWLNFLRGNPTSCFRGNSKAGGDPATTSPVGVQHSHSHCDGSKIPANGNTTFLSELLCNTQVSLNPPAPPSCPSGPYPRPHGAPTMHRLPRHLRTMPDPCAGVPANPWCRARRGKGGFTG
jgi:hypothetical protein